MDDRYWDRWNVSGVAERLEAYWINSDFEQRHRGQLRRLCSRYLTSRSDTLLEVGCGTGLVFKQLAPDLTDVERYTGVDSSHRMLSLARQKYPDARLLPGDGYSLDFPDRTFDVAICFEVLGHIPMIEKIIGELIRVTRRAAIFTVWPAVDLVVEERQQEFGETFLYRYYPHEYVMECLAKVAPPEGVVADLAILLADCWAYIARRDPAAGGGVHLGSVYPVPCTEV